MGIPVRDRRHEVLRMLRATPQPMTIAEVAAAMGVHANTVRFHLDTLCAHGQVESVPPPPGPRSSGRPARMFGAVRAMDRTGPRHYQLLADVLTRHLASSPHAAERATEAGRDWGRGLAARGLGDTAAADVDVGGELAGDELGGDELGGSRADGAKAIGPHRPPVGRAPVEHLLELLDDLGFAPERHGAAVDLRHCPFLELAEVRSQVVCPLHLGLMQGALEGTPVGVDRLDPFVEPDRCVAHLTGVAG
ncbi:MAG: helix-turn-helix domain-containing protein [Propionibacteriales bacterium]|nr:helix-turn-helix domain-containing protein [Propionibacteriales bacterium]